MMKIKIYFGVVCIALFSNACGQKKQSELRSSQPKIYSLSDFNFKIVEDTLKRLPQKGYERIKKWDELFKVRWADSLFNKKGYQTFDAPLLKNGIVFSANSMEFVWGGRNGERIKYGSPEAKLNMRSFGSDSLIFVDDINKKGIVTNFCTGNKVIIENYYSAYSKTPVLLTGNIGLFIKRYDNLDDKIQLVAIDIYRQDSVWSSMPLDRTSFEMTHAYNHVYVTTKNALYAIELKTGKIIWSLSEGISYIKVDGHFLYLGLSASGGLVALDVSQPIAPKVLFQLKLDKSPQYVIKDDNILFIQAETLTAFDQNTLKYLWKSEWLFSFDIGAQLGLSEKYIFSEHTEDIYSYTVIFNKKTGELMSYDPDTKYLVAESYFENLFFASNTDNTCIYAFEIK